MDANQEFQNQRLLNFSTTIIHSENHNHFKSLILPLHIINDKNNLNISNLQTLMIPDHNVIIN